MPREENPPAASPAAAPIPSEEAQLVQRVRRRDPEAGSRLVREQYPRIYRYLLYLTNRPEVAEDLTQETFLQAWRSLESLDERAPLGPWLHRIAHREFLQALRQQRRSAERLTTSLEELAELPAPEGHAWADTIHLHSLISRLPVEERELVILHYLEGYEYGEIARILGVPVGRVRHRLSEARCHLQRELAEGDLPYLNDPSVPMRGWAWLPLDRMYALEARLSIGEAWRRAEPRSKAATEETMERREFLRQAAAGAAGLMLTEPEKEIVDPRLTQKVTCAFKGTALSDLCEKLKSDTGISVTAGPSVADEKVTLFCEKLPLREVMRQLSRPFGYTWLRSGTPGQYRYELVQDLRSQLLEEELRNRDRNAALLALEQEIERYRPHLNLSPDEALERSTTAAPADKPLLETLAGVGWGPIQIYFRLSPQQLAVLRAGEALVFSAEPKAGEHPLPSDLARGVLQCNRVWRVAKAGDGGFGASYAGSPGTTDPKALPLTAVPEVHPMLKLSLSQSELGQFTLGGASGFFTSSSSVFEGAPPLAVGMSPAAVKLDNAQANAKLARDPLLRPAVTVHPQPSCGRDLSPSPSHAREGVPEEQERSGAGGAPGPKATTADILEALHQASGLPVIADFYTRLYKPEAAAVKDRALFDTLNELAEAMRMRWNKEEGAAAESSRSAGSRSWLQFRSASYYHDRLKEVPNRLLSRWAAARRQQGILTLDDLVEIAQLSDAQLDGEEMAEGASECWGLKEWGLLRSRGLRPHVRYLAEFTPVQRQEMMSATGLPFTRMSLTQQQGFLSRALENTDEPLQTLEELAGATLRVDYTHPGWYQWGKIGDFASIRWAIRVTADPGGRRVLMPPVRERTREVALREARRLFPPVTDAMLQAYRRYVPELTADQLVPQEAQIVPTELDLVIVYIPGTSTTHSIHWVRTTQDLRG